MLFKSKSTYDYLVVGLGNPESKYDGTRHNIGFFAADKFYDEFSVAAWKKKGKALIADCKVGDQRILLAKPLTYMNLSGEAVTELVHFYKISTENIIVMFDDISLPVGGIRVRASGSHGGHNGMKNISQCLGTNDIKRVKIGVGAKPNPEYDLANWVLGHFPKDEQPVVQTAAKTAVDAVETMIKKGIEAAMNEFNRLKK